jgi:hypothetical protein
MRGDEGRVVEAYEAWLEQNGWNVLHEVGYVDVYAERGDDQLYAEVKGRTTSPGLDVDTLYGRHFAYRNGSEIACRSMSTK